MDRGVSCTYTPPTRYYLAADCSPDIGVPDRFVWSVRIIDENTPNRPAVVWQTGHAKSHIEGLGRIVVIVEAWHRRTYPAPEPDPVLPLDSCAVTVDTTEAGAGPATTLEER